MLKIGDKAPEFTGIDHNGNEISLNKFKGKKLVLYFYPKDNTPGCTAEACDLRDNYQRFIAEGYEVVGVSKDSTKSHQKFIDKHELPFPLISDESKEIQKMYDAWGKKKMMGREYEGTLRKTFVIDEEGTIMDIIEKVKTKEHSSQILQ
jgi:peroxiredoxin Q/BCP